MQRRFRRTVVSISGPGAKTTQRSHVNDPAAPLAQMGQRLLRDEKWPPHVGRENRVPLLKDEIFELDGFVIPGIIDQDIDAAKFLYDGFNSCAHTLRV